MRKSACKSLLTEGSGRESSVQPVTQVAPVAGVLSNTPPEVHVRVMVSEPSSEDLEDTTVISYGLCEN